MASIDDESIVVVQAICECSRKRAEDLLEAGGSVERAVDIHITQQEQGQCHGDVGNQIVDNDLPVYKSDSSLVLTCGASGVDLGMSRSMIPNDGTVVPLHEKAMRDGLDRQNHPHNDVCLEERAIHETNNHIPHPQTPKRELQHQPCSKKPRTTEHPNHFADERLQYLSLAQAFSKMSETTKRLEKLDYLQNALQGIIDAVGGIGHGDEQSRQDDGRILQFAMELIVGGSLTLQVSGAAVSKAIMTVTGASSSQLRNVYRETGDLGDTAARFLRNQRLLLEPKPLTILTVYETLQQIGTTCGTGSQTERHALMVKLLRSCKASEVRFLVRTLLGNMRLGANMRTAMAALAIAINRDSGTNDNAVKQVQDTFDFCPKIDKACLALLVGGVAHMVKTCTLTVGTCISPMLANPARSLDEVAQIMSTGGPIVAEWKYDGVRCQAHYSSAKATLYSRHMLENTEQFPDAVESIIHARKDDDIHSFIIDAEIVGVKRTDLGEWRLLPFQNLSTRRRIQEEKNTPEVEVKVFAFDLMYLNGESLVKKALWERQQLLQRHFRATDGFGFAQSIPLLSFDECLLTQYLRTAVAGGAEGLMIKLTGERKVKNDKNKLLERSTLKSASETQSMCQYESGVRSRTWLKVKRDYVEGFADTVDLVPIGAWFGNGRKAQKGFLSPVLLAVYDEEEEVFRSICRCMSFTDAMYNSMRNFYLDGVPYPQGVGVEGADEPMNCSTSDDEKSVNDIVDDSTADDFDSDSTKRINCYPTRPTGLVITDENPSIWFKPLEVFEVSFADLTLSKQHSAAAGIVDPTRGVALRFPRFKRRRPDKRIELATTTTQIAEMFAKQAKQQGTN